VADLVDVVTAFGDLGAEVRVLAAVPRRDARLFGPKDLLERGAAEVGHTAPTDLDVKTGGDALERLVVERREVVPAVGPAKRGRSVDERS